MTIMYNLAETNEGQRVAFIYGEIKPGQFADGEVYEGEPGFPDWLAGAVPGIYNGETRELIEKHAPPMTEGLVS